MQAANIVSSSQMTAMSEYENEMYRQAIKDQADKEAYISMQN